MRSARSLGALAGARIDLADGSVSCVSLARRKESLMSISVQSAGMAGLPQSPPSASLGVEQRRRGGRGGRGSQFVRFCVCPDSSLRRSPIFHTPPS